MLQENNKDVCFRGDTYWLHLRQLLSNTDLLISGLWFVHWIAHAVSSSSFGSFH